MTSQGTFDINKFDVIIGAWRLEGYAKDSFIKVTFDENVINSSQGVDGQVTVVITKKSLATIEVALEQSSRSNDILSGYLLGSMAGSISEPVLIKDKKGDTIYSSLSCWIEKFPEVTYSSEAQNRTWSIKAPLIAFVGGNSL